MLWEIFVHAFEDSITLLPLLFLTYYVMEYIEHKIGHQNKDRLQKLSKYGPAIGSVLGIFPQCGFSSVASGFYAGKVITLGTLLSVYLSTSDEMLPVMISKGTELSLIAKILGLKVLVGFSCGMVTDWIIRKRSSNVLKNCPEDKMPAAYRNKQNKHKKETDVEFKFSVYNNKEYGKCYCSSKGGIFIGALRHSLSTFFFIFLITVVLTFVMHEFGEERIAGFIFNRPLIGEALAGVIGLIPNCAASVVLTELYLEGQIAFSAMMSGLFVESGVGILVLFRERRKYRKENLKIVGLLYGIGVLAGWVILAAQ